MENNVVPYNWDRGMRVMEQYPLALQITLLDGTKQIVNHIKFYDTIHGFIQTTDGIFYMPKEPNADSN